MKRRQPKAANKEAVSVASIERTAQRGGEVRSVSNRPKINKQKKRGGRDPQSVRGSRPQNGGHDPRPGVSTPDRWVATPQREKKRVERKEENKKSSATTLGSVAKSAVLAHY